MNIRDRWNRFLLDESGPTSVEYAIMILLILLVCIMSVQVLGTSLDSSLSDSHSRMTTSGLGR